MISLKTRVVVLPGLATFTGQELAKTLAVVKTLRVKYGQETLGCQELARKRSQRVKRRGREVKRRWEDVASGQKGHKKGGLILGHAPNLHEQGCMAR